MKIKGQYRRWLFLVAAAFILGGLPATAEAQPQIDIQWALPPGASPVAFPVGSFVSGELNDQVQFSDLNPIFRLLITGDGPDRVKLRARMESFAAGEVFNVWSDPIDFDYLASLGLVDNTVLANDPQINLGAHSDVGVADLMGFTDGNSIIEDHYVLYVFLTALDEENVLDMDQLEFDVLNRDGMLLQEPGFDETVWTPTPMFIWEFPRLSGVSFNFQLVMAPDGQETRDPWSVINDYIDQETYRCADVVISNPASLPGSGDQTFFLYTGSGEQKPLTPGKTYCWRVSADMLRPDGETDQIWSVASRFMYGAGGEGGGYGEEGGAPLVEDPVITLLRQVLGAEDFSALEGAFEDFAEWELAPNGIRIDGYTVSFNDLTRFLLLGEREVSLDEIIQ